MSYPLKPEVLYSRSSAVSIPGLTFKNPNYSTFILEASHHIGNLIILRPPALIKPKLSTSRGLVDENEALQT